jgi:hypothetical protein
MRSMIAVLVSLSLSACAVPREVNNVFQRFACERHGGTVTERSMIAGPMCSVPFEDGGKECLDGSECDGDCLTYASVPPGTEVKGMCEFRVESGVCIQPVVNGVASEALCE